MKKTKLLTSLAALALVVSLGACNEPTEDNTSGTEEPTTSETTTSETTSEDNTSESTSEDNTTSETTSDGNSSSEEPPATSIDELTFIVTLYVDGVADSVPSYGTLYYKGGLNGGLDEDNFWSDGEYVALTETTNSKGEVAYTTTFKEVEIREDYDFSLLFYYSDETVGSSYSSHVVAPYISSPLPSSGTVGEYEVTLSTSLSEKFPDLNAGGNEDAVIAQAILDAVLGTTPNWEAFYGYAEDDLDEPITEYLTIDSDGNLYGYKNCEEFGDDDDEYIYFYYGGYKCVDGKSTAQEVDTTYEDELNFFASPVNISFNLETDTYELSEVEGGYALTIARYTNTANAYTFNVDGSYNLISIDRDTQIGSQSDEIATGHVEGITYAEVEAALAETGFDLDDFDLGGNDDGDDEGGIEDLEIAQAILDAVNDGVSWDAFHGEYIEEDSGTETVYLTEDDDGMYGSILDYSNDKLSFAYYYQDGNVYEHAVNRDEYSVDEQWEDYSDHLDDYIEEQLDGAEDFDLESDDYQLKEYEDGYELIVTTDFMGYYEYEYIYIVDGDFNVTALAYGEYFAGDLEGWYAEEATYEQVAASMSDFHRADWMSNEEIALAITEWAAETDDIDDLPELWPATHIRYYAMDEDEDIEYWVTSDENDCYYGKVVEQDLEGEYYDTRYYLENYYFSEAYYGDDEAEYDWDSYYGEGQYGDEINFVTYPIMDAEGFLDEDDDGELIFSDDISYELTKTDDGYKLDIVHGDWWDRDDDCLYTYYTDEDLNVYKTEFIEGSEENEDYHYNMIELIDYEDVQAQMADFYDNISLWLDD